LDEEKKGTIEEDWGRHRKDIVEKTLRAFFLRGESKEKP